MSFDARLHDAIQRFVGLLDDLGVPYAVGGAVAMAFAGYVRGTRDVDVLVLLPALRTQEFADRAGAAGFTMRDEADAVVAIDALRLIRSTREFALFRVWWQDTKIEVFTPRIPLQDAILRRRTRADLGTMAMWITTAEDLILLKMIFHRPKDLEDVRRLLAANVGSLDVGYLREWMGKTLEAATEAELRELMIRSGMP